MTQHSREQGEIRLYLLGLLPDEPRQRLEERLLTDSSLYEELLIAEDELIDQHLAGRLDERERAAFESNFMSAPGRAGQVRFAAALRRYAADKAAAPADVTTQTAAEPAARRNAQTAARLLAQTGTQTGDEASAGRRTGADERRLTDAAGHPRGLLSWLRSRNPALAFALTAAALLLIFGLSWLILRGIRPSLPGRVVALTLTPDVHTRGGDASAQRVATADAGTLRLRLRLASEDFQTYRAALLDADSGTIMTADSLKPEQSDDGPAVVLDVPARSAPPGDYRVRLEGVSAGGRAEVAGTYRFTISAR